MTSDVIDQLSPLAADVRERSPDRYLATLFAPPERRNSLFALYAFDHEIARVRTVVREPMAGLVRLQWWDDVIDGFEADEKVAHPVVAALRRVVVEDGLDPAYLKRAIDGRRRQFEQDQPIDPESLERYLLDAGGSITCAAAALLGTDEPDMLALADRVGMTSVIWEEISASHREDRSPSFLLSNEGEDIGSLAQREIAAARGRQMSISRAKLGAFFPATLAEIRLRNPARYLQQSVLSTAVPRLIWCWMRSRF